MVTPAEIETGKPIGRSTNKWHVVSVAEVATWIAPDSGTNDNPSAAARFQPTQRVRARNINPIAHTRLPRYARGKIGTIARVRGVDVFPDAVTQGLGKKPQHVYTVHFTAQELWGAPASRNDSVYADLWEDYLEPA